MIVYVITKGEYSDYHICAVTTDKDNAEALRERFTDIFEDAEIEEFDTEFYNEILRFENTYTCEFIEKDNRIKVRKTTINSLEERQVVPFRDGLLVDVHANNEQDAMKFASDKFAKYRAEHMGL